MLSPEQLTSIVRGTVVRVDLTDGVGKEQNKVRPAVVVSSESFEAVVVSSDTLNKRIVTIIVVPISGLKDKKPYKHEMFIRKGEGNLTEDSGMI
jgi:mRNA-degrading endonuclease toxin of MazEF toxin-antitoxin module